jgi:1,4-dihydroxy-2-naphthoate octaprenyltransferase
MVIIKNLFQATRPSFLLITILGCLIGTASPDSHQASWHIQALSIMVAITVHAAANVMNDYFDHINGSDALNTDRISPFTGGSRFIQNQTLSPQSIFYFAAVLALICISIGLYVCYETTWLLMPIGLMGIFIGWAYSAPPLELMSKGIFGEIAIAIAWSLIVIGFAALETHQFEMEAILLGLAYGLMVSNILLINQIPDIRADMTANKLTLATRYSKKGLQYWYTCIWLAAYLSQLSAVFYFSAPKISLITAVLIPAFLRCARQINDAALSREKLKTLIIHNIVSVHLYAALLCIALFI